MVLVRADKAVGSNQLSESEMLGEIETSRRVDVIWSIFQGMVLW